MVVVPVGEDNLAVRVGHPDQRRGAVGHVAEPRLALAQRFLGPAALRDVLADLEEPADHTPVAAQRPDGAVNEHPRPVLANVPAAVQGAAFPARRLPLVLVPTGRPVPGGGQDGGKVAAFLLPAPPQDNPPPPPPARTPGRPLS